MQSDFPSIGGPSVDGGYLTRQKSFKYSIEFDGIEAQILY